MKIKILKAYTNAHFPKLYVRLGTVKHKSHSLIHKVKSYARLRLAAWKQKEFDDKYHIDYALRDALNKLGDLHKFSPAIFESLPFLDTSCDTKHIVMMVVSALRIDPRVERESRALVRAGYRVTVICPDISSPTLKDAPINWGEGIEFDILTWEAASYLNTYPFLFGEKMLDAALKYRPLAFHCHDLSTSLAGLAAARTIGCRCVCDFHEWYSENVTWDAANQKYTAHPESTREIYRAAETLVMARADEVITVCNSIANELQTEYQRYQRKVHVIRNIPDLNFRAEEQGASLRSSLGLDSSKLILLYQGGTGPTRFLEPAIEAIKALPNVIFVIRGPSLDLFGEGYTKLAKEHGVEDRLVLLPPVKSSSVVAAASTADVGLWSLPKLSKNFYYALPNKIFEYLAAGIPIVCANFPEAKAIVEGYDVGSTFDPYDPQSIAQALAQCTPEKLAHWKKNVPLALDALNASAEWDKLVDIYKSLEQSVKKVKG